LGSTTNQYPFKYDSKGVVVTKTIHFDPSLPFMYVPMADFLIIGKELIGTTPSISTSGYSGI